MLVVVYEWQFEPAGQCIWLSPLDVRRGNCLGMSAIQFYVRFLSLVLQGLAVGFIHNARARKSCGGIPFDISYIGYLVSVAAADPCVAALTTYPQDRWHGWNLCFAW